MSIAWFIEVDNVLHPGSSLVLANGNLSLETPGAQPFCLAHLIHPYVNYSGTRLVLLVPWLRRVTRSSLRSQLPHWLQVMAVDFLDTHVELDVATGLKPLVGTWPAVSEYLQLNRLRDWVALVGDDAGWPGDQEVRRRLFVLPSPSGLDERSAREGFRVELNELERQAASPFTVSLTASHTPPRRMAVQERWLMRVAMPSFDAREDVDVVVHNEQNGETYECLLKDQEAEPMLHFLVHAFCRARWRTPEVPEDEESEYLWSEATLEIRRGDGLIAPAIFRLTLELTPHEMRVVHRWGREPEVVAWRERSGVCLDPLSILMRELSGVEKDPR